MSTRTEKLTFEDWLALPETRQRYEIVDGELIMPRGPTPDHQWLSRSIFRKLDDFVEERGLGVARYAPLDLLIQREPLRTRQADILYLSAERSGVRGIADLEGMQYLEAPPDLVVEVLSPSNARREMESKLEDYRRIGVLECWLVSPEAETVEVLSFSPDGISSTGIYGIDGTVRSRVLGDLTVPLREVFR
jgi:Uma2 family endonuclease